MQKTGRFFRIAAPFLKLVFPLREKPDIAHLPTGAVYLCRHGNNAGPPYTFLYLGGFVRPWVFSAFCEEKACFSHTYHYTFLERCKLPRPIAWIAARASAFFAPKMVRSLRAIAVYRNGAKSMLTLRESIKALLAGESILLFPDVDYTSENGGVGELYKGFCCWNACIAQRRGSIFRLCPLW